MMETSDAGGVSANHEGQHRYLSLAPLRAAHRDLLQRHRESGATAELVIEAETFIHRGRETGALLDVEEDRWAAQSLLDYWATLLQRAGHEPPDSSLAEFDPVLAPELDDANCPFLGLDAFRESHHALFFGRNRLVQEMVDHLQRNRLLAVSGPSGSGKSSLVLAGLLPALRGGALPGSGEWDYYPAMVPGSNPLANLAELFCPPEADAEEWQRRHVERFRQDTSHLCQLLAGKGGTAVLVVDQFEELFTLSSDAETVKAFVANLAAVVQAAEAQHIVILTMRSDFEPHIARLGEFQPLFEAATVRATPLNAGELREAIEKPARLAGLRFQSGVVDGLLQDILGEPAALPLLQFTLLKLWENRQRNRVTWETYQRLGGGRLALARSADEFYERLIPEDRVTARRLLLRLVRPGEGLEVMSNRVRRETLYQAGEPRHRIDAVLERLLEARLVRLTGAQSADDAQVEVAHEALVRNWPRLVSWLEDERETIRRRLRLTAAAEQWRTLGRDPGALLRGPLLDEAGRYPDLNELEAEFVQASHAQVEAEYEREIARQRELVRTQAWAEAERLRAEEQALTARRLRRLLLGLALVFLLALAAATVAATQMRRAQTEAGARASEVAVRSTAEANARENEQLAATRAAEAFSARQAAEEAAHARETEVVVRTTAEARAVQNEQLAAIRAQEAGAAQATAQADRDRAEWQLLLSTSRELAAVALTNLEADPERSTLLALEAVSVTYPVQGLVTYQAENALHQAIQAVRVERVLRGHTGQVQSVAFSPDGEIVATASTDRTAKVWDVATGEELLTFGGHTDVVWGVTFSPDGALLATASADGTAKIWDLASAGELLTLSGHAGPVWRVAFSPDGARLVTSSDDRTAKIWDAHSGEELLTLAGHTDFVRDVAFSPDGTRVATTSNDLTARVWDTASGAELATFDLHTDYVWGIAFSPDGARVATASADGTAKVWDAVSGEQYLSLSRHTGAVLDVAYSPHGALLATASWKTAKIWSAVSGEELFSLAGHTGYVWDLAFSPDGTLLITGSTDNTARLWNISASKELFTLRGHDRPVRDVTYSPDGTRLVSVGEDATVRVWDAESGEELLVLSGHGDWVESIHVSSDATRMISASGDGTARVWDATSGETLHVLSGHDDWVEDAAFSPDGTRLATASRDGTVKLWDAASGRELLTLSGHTSWVWAVEFSPDGTQLATASEDGTAKVWDAATGQELLTFTGHTDRVRALAYNPDGQRLATASIDETARVWDATSGTELLILAGHASHVRDVAFSPDGSRLATTSGDRTTKVWDASSGVELLTLYGHSDWVRGVAFSPDGRHLATAGRDGTVRVYVLPIEELGRLACSRVTRNLTQAEWELYMGTDLPYHRTCPNLPQQP